MIEQLNHLHHHYHICVCVCVCVCIYTYIYMCVCVCIYIYIKYISCYLYTCIFYYYIHLTHIQYLHSCQYLCQFSSIQFSHSVVSDSLRPHESQHARPPCPSPTPRVHSDTSVHRVSDAIQPSHPLSFPAPPAPEPSQYQSLYQRVNS